MVDKDFREFEGQIRKLARERFTDREIAAKIGLPLTTVQDLRARFRIPSGSTPLEVTAADLADMVAAARPWAQRPWSARDGA